MFYSKKLGSTFKRSKEFKFSHLSKLTGSLLGLILIFMMGCGPSYQELKFREESKLISDSVTNYSGLVANDTIDGLPQHVIQKAELKFKVDNVVDASFEIEKLIALQGGYVQESKLDSKIVFSTEVQSQPDSICDVQRYHTSHVMTIRVPKSHLDSVLKQLTKLAQFIDYKYVQTKDIKLKLLSNQLAESRYQNFIQHSNQHLKQNQKDKNQPIQQSILLNDELKHTKRIETLELVEQAYFSEIQLSMYQSETELANMRVAKSLAIKYELDYGMKLTLAFKNGLDVVLKALLFLIENWGYCFLISGFIIVGRNALLKLKGKALNH